MLTATIKERKAVMPLLTTATPNEIMDEDCAVCNIYGLWACGVAS